MNKLVGKVAEGATKGLLKVKNAKHTPKVMLIAGVTAIVGGGVWACVQTLKLEDKVDEAKESIDHIKALKESGEYVVNAETGETAEYTKSCYNKDILWSYGQFAKDVIKLYVGPVVVATVGVALVTGSNKILTDRLSQMTLTATALSEAYNKYRQNVIADQGEEADRRYRLGIETKKNFEMQTIDPETGAPIVRKEKSIDLVNDIKNVASPYAIIANDCGWWRMDSNWDASQLNAYLNLAQLKYDLQGYLYLYEVYEMLEISKNISPEAIAMSHQVGWVKGHGDDQIRFEPISTHLGSEDVFRDVLLIDFNCYGAINDLVANRAWVKF